MKRLYIAVIVAGLFLLVSCGKKNSSPKPRGYFRIDLPKKEYQVYDSICPFKFEYPTYGELEFVGEEMGEPCWFNISFPKYKAKIYLTYKHLDNNLASHIEDVHTLVYKHIIKADDIQENIVLGVEDKVYGVIYNLSGNTAAATTFFITDSTNHFLTGSLYFSAQPNKDSLAPSIKFFQEDIVHLTESLTWK